MSKRKPSHHNRAEKRFNNGLDKREAELREKVYERNEAMTCTIREMLEVNGAKGFITYKDLRLKSMERR